MKIILIVIDTNGEDRWRFVYERKNMTYRHGDYCLVYTLLYLFFAKLLFERIKNSKMAKYQIQKNILVIQVC